MRFTWIKASARFYVNQIIPIVSTLHINEKWSQENNLHTKFLQDLFKSFQT